jgi:peptidoglycan/LPS O-acetylase OafA/YrhL
MLASTCGCGCAMACLTYHFAEIPIRTKQRLATGKALSKVAAGAAGMILRTGLLFQASKGLPR